MFRAPTLEASTIMVVWQSAGHAWSKCLLLSPVYMNLHNVAMHQIAAAVFRYEAPLIYVLNMILTIGFKSKVEESSLIP